MTSHVAVEAELLAQVLRPGARVLDAGSGRRTRLVEHRELITELIGIDIDGAACAANDALDSVFVGNLCTRLPFPAQSFDVVYTNLVIEHLKAPAAAFAKWRRVMRASGNLILLTVTVPARRYCSASSCRSHCGSG